MPDRADILAFKGRYRGLERQRKRGRSGSLFGAGLLVVLPLLTLGAGAQTAAAQGWSWPWETQERAPRREPYRDPSRAPDPRLQPRTDFGAQAAPLPADRGDICLDLERRLASEVNRSAGSGEQREALRQRVAQLDRNVRRAELQLERGECWEQFFFQRTLRNTRACVTAYRTLESERQQLQDAQSELQNFSADRSQRLQEDIIAALARNGCGAAYEQQARRTNPNPFSGFFQDEESPSDRFRNTYRGLPFATYRTLCVRLCDGYYFPVSFSTLPTYFQRDADTCQAQCAAPTTLYYHQNPGGSIEQMQSAFDNSMYTALPTAFRYRKTFVSGCSCKPSEYIPEGTAVSAGPTATEPQQRRFSPMR